MPDRPGGDDLSQLATMPRRGRPALTEDPDMRARMVACATDWKVIRASLGRVTSLYGVHPNTVRNWTRRALRFKGPDGDRLRALVSLTPELHDCGQDGDAGNPGGGDPLDD